MHIRTANVDDAEQILGIYAYYVANTAISFEYEVPTLDEFARRMERTLRRYPYLVAEHNGQVQGYAYAGPLKDRAAYDRSCEVSIYVSHDTRGRGYGSALYQELERRLAAMGVLNLYACIAVPIEEDEYLTNGSERFHARVGYAKIGEFHKCGYKFGRWYNMIWMEKLIGTHDRLAPASSS